MTRTARMPKKKHLDATPWEEMKLKSQDEQKNDEIIENVREENMDDFEAGNVKEKKNKKKSRKRERNNNEGEESSSSKKSKRELDNATEINTESKKSKKKKEKKLKAVHTPETESNSIPTEVSETEHKKDKKKKKKIKDSHTVEVNIDTVKSENEDKSQSKNSKVQAKNHNYSVGTYKSHRELKLEKQREARRRRRAIRKGLICFHCRQSGHTTATCPETNKQGSGVGVCYKCGSTDHTTKNCKKDTSKDENPFPFAKCFICGETGHLVRSCPDNPKGLYPKGGSCNVCGSVEHLKKDCPENIKLKNTDANVKSGTSLKKISKFTSADSDVISDEETRDSGKIFKRKKEKVVKF